jgi:D-cysteine desulfhydrase family pyridoxal phosphate-dependent enzyme
MKEIDRIRIAHLPTVVEELPNLTKQIGGPQLLIKRDDLTGLACGGNKIRKLEFLVADAKKENAKMVITAGAAQSNHCRQTAAVAARTGLNCTLVLSYPFAEKTPPELGIHESGNLLIDELLGAEIVWHQPGKRDQILQETYETAKKAKKSPYLIPYGGSNKIGALAYAFGMQELIEQQVDVDWIVFASSSGGTQAGMILGARLFGFKGKILGISVDEPQDVLQQRVAGLASEAAKKLGEKVTFSAQEVLVNSDYTGGGYGVMSSLERDAIHLLAKSEGLLLDPVYTGRAMGGLLDLIQKDFFAKKDQRILFWHTGGTPALFADQYMDSLLV